MSEVIDVDPVEEDTPRVGGTISIEISDQSVRYDSDMSLPDVVFWIETVKSMIVDQVIGDKNNE